MKPLRIYVNVTYCINRCLFCADENHNVEDNMREDYYDALVKDVEQFAGSYKDDYEVESIYFGGGVPSMIRPNVITRILEAIRENFTLSENCEITLKAFPGKLNDNYFSVYVEQGINRISLDYLTHYLFTNNFLKHVISDGAMNRTYPIFLENEFDNVNYDLGIGLPGQSKELLAETIHVVSDTYKAAQITLYPFDMSNKAIQDVYAAHPEYYQNEHRFIPAVNDLLKEAKKLLEAAGYQEYLPNCYGRDGHTCKEFILRDQNVEYIGIGCGSYSKVDGVSYSITKDIKKYIANSDNFEMVAENIQAYE